jgi:hypothetical protein
MVLRRQSFHDFNHGKTITGIGGSQTESRQGAPHRFGLLASPGDKCKDSYPELRVMLSERQESIEE